MIKATGKWHDGRPLVMFGLSDENILRLRQGQPIKVESEELNWPGGPVIVIFAGESEESMLTELRKEGLITGMSVRLHQGESTDGR